MLDILCKLYLNNKSDKTTINFPSSVICYSLEKCTWRFSLPEMNNPNYMLLYGVLINTCNSSEDLKEILKEQLLDLWLDGNYAMRDGKKIIKKCQNNTKFGINNKSFNIFAIIVSKGDILDTTDKEVIDYVKKNKNIKEEVLLKSICLNKHLGVYKYPPKVKPVRENSRLLEILEPALFKVVDTNYILDAAVGETNIKKLIDKYNSQQTKTKVKEETSNKKISQPVKKQSTVKKEGQLFPDGGANQILETAGKIEEGVENLFSKVIKR